MARRIGRAARPKIIRSARRTYLVGAVSDAPPVNGLVYDPVRDCWTEDGEPIQTDRQTVSYPFRIILWVDKRRDARRAFLHFCNENKISAIACGEKVTARHYLCGFDVGVPNIAGNGEALFSQVCSHRSVKDCEGVMSRRVPYRGAGDGEEKPRPMPVKQRKPKSSLQAPAPRDFDTLQTFLDLNRAGMVR